MEARHWKVEGRVQGVGFRWFTMRQARSLRLTGWVKNCPDRSVEVWAEGTSNSLDRLEEQLKQGPAGSHVSRVICTSGQTVGCYTDFDVSY